MKHTSMDGESVQKSLSTFHVRFQQEKMKVVKADTGYLKRIQDFQRRVERERKKENLTMHCVCWAEMALNTSNFKCIR